MRRVVITGLGITSCLGLDAKSVTESLRQGRSGISANPTYAELGMRSQVSGSIDVDLTEHIDRKLLRFMGNAAGFAYMSLQQAISDADLEADDISNPKTGLIMGSGGASSQSQVEAADILRERGVKRLGSLPCYSDDGLDGLSKPSDCVPDKRY